MGKLEEIKEQVKLTTHRDISATGTPFIKDMNWLIERVEELEKAIKVEMGLCETKPCDICDRFLKIIER